MKKENILTALTIAILMICTNAQAQGRGRNDHRENMREMRIHANGKVQMQGANSKHHAPNHQAMPPQHHMDLNRSHRPAHQAMHRPAPHVAHHRPVPHVAHHHRVDHRGFLPGWGGRVRYHEGRWGYLRHNHWYWYDCYFDPDYYFAHPVAQFHSHISLVAAGVIGGAVLGAVIGALCR